MTSAPKKIGRPFTGGRENPITLPLRVSAEIIAQIDAVIESRGGGQSRSSVFREAADIGISQILAEIKRRKAKP